MNPTILVVEDEPAIQELVAINLKHAGFLVVRAGSAEEGESAIRAALPDLVILDWMLPGQSGVALAKKLRADDRTRELPIIMLTARVHEEDKIQGLEAGADDYVIKPVAPEELASRIRAVTRRAAGQVSSAWEIGKLRIDTGRRELQLDSVRVALSPREFQIVEELARYAGEVVPKHRMARVLQPYGEPLEFSTLDWHIHNLRRKLGADIIQTVRGVGYCLGE